MSREIIERKVVLAEDLWIEMQDLSTGIDMWAEDEVAKTSEQYKLILMGRKEMLDLVMDYVHNNEIRLDDLLQGFGYEAKMGEMK